MLAKAGRKYTNTVIFQFGIIRKTLKAITSPIKAEANIIKAIFEAKKLTASTHGMVYMQAYTTLLS